MRTDTIYRPKTRKSFLRKLLEDAWFRGSGLWSNGKGLDYQRTGRPIPEHLLPGRFIDGLSKEEREILKTLTDRDLQEINWRPKDITPYRLAEERRQAKKKR